MHVQAKARTATGMQVDVMEDGVADTDLFALSAIKVAYPIHFAALDWSKRKIYIYIYIYIYILFILGCSSGLSCYS
jgi:hypothetical protein